MADFPENKIEQTEDEDELSTVFSAPVEHKKVKTNKNRKIWIVISCILGVALVIGATVFLIKNIETKDSKDQKQAEEQAEKLESQLNASVVNLKEYKPEEISQVKIQVGSKVNTLYSEREEVDTGDVYTYWYVKDIKKTVTDSDKISEVVGGVSTLVATKEITEKTAAECGVDKPWMSAVVTPVKGEKYTVEVGNLSPDGSGYYIKFTTSDKIYHIKSTGENESFFQFNVMNMFGGELMTSIESNEDTEEYFQNGSVSKFDKLTITGKNFKEPLVIICNNDETMSQYLGYIVVSPSNRIAQNVEAPLLIFQSDLNVLGAYSYDVEEKTLKKFGLDKPDIELKLELGGHTYIYKFAMQEDGDYAAIRDGSEFISKVSADDLEEISKKTTIDFYSTWICYNSIDDLSNFTIKTKDKNYSFDIKQKNIESEDGESTEKEYTITHNGKKLTALNFQYLYQYCVTLKCLDFELENINTEPEITFEFNFKKGGKSVIEFRKVSATKYQYRVDGVDMGRVSVNSINKVVKNAEKVSKGETIDQLA